MTTLFGWRKEGMRKARLSIKPPSSAKRTKWKVEIRVLGGWQDAGWEDDDKPKRFVTKETAEHGIDWFIMEARRDGGLQLNRDDYRAVPAEDEP